MISRETRRLLVTILISVTALWVLARIRFQERPAPSTPVPNVLAQLRPVSSYADLARVIADIRPAIVAAMSASPRGGAALRIREDTAVTLAPGPADTVLAADRATGLAIVRRERGDAPGLLPWAPRLLDYPRYLVAADVADGNVTLRPVFVGGLFTSTSPFWPGELWALPPGVAIAPGTFVFTTEGALAGLAVRHGEALAIVPPQVLQTTIDELRQRGEPGDLGIAIQPLSPLIAAAAGASSGVVISAIDADSNAAGALAPTDIIEAVNGQEIRTADDWRARAARATAGGTFTLRVRNSEGVREVQVTAMPLTAPAEPADDASLGLRLRAIPKVGVEVLSVQPRSRSARAGLRPGDVVTVAAGERSPTPAQVVRAYAALPSGGSLLAAVTRGNEHLVIAIEK